jgi:hypothetical protein
MASTLLNIMRHVAILSPTGTELKFSMVASSREVLLRNMLAQFPGWVPSAVQPSLDLDVDAALILPPSPPAIVDEGASS